MLLRKRWATVAQEMRLAIGNILTADLSSEARCAKEDGEGGFHTFTFLLPSASLHYSAFPIPAFAEIAGRRAVWNLI